MELRATGENTTPVKGKAAIIPGSRSHTAFHRFTEIGQIFRKKYIFSKKL